LCGGIAAALLKAQQRMAHYAQAGAC